MISSNIFTNDHRSLERRRFKKGPRNNKSMFIDSDVIKIKNMISEGISLKEIARKYHVTPSAISAIKCGITWSHIK